MEILIEWLPRVGALLTVVLGLVGFFKPRLIPVWVHIPQQHSLTEIVQSSFRLCVYFVEKIANTIWRREKNTGSSE